MRLLHTLQEIEEAWVEYDDFQASPYQSFAWYREWLESVAHRRGAAPLAIIWDDERGQPLMLLPLVCVRRYGLRIATFAGDSHSNLNMPLLGKRIITPTVIFDRSILKSAGIDAIILKAMLHQFRNELNPLLHNGAWRHTADRFVLSLTKSNLAGRYWNRHEKRKKNARYINHHVSTGDALNGRELLRTFFEQRQVWSAIRNIPDVFDDPSIMNFFEQLYSNSLSGMRLHYLTANQKVVAVAGTLRRSDTEALMFVSYERESKVAKLSPGLFLIGEAIQCAQRDGMILFDFGLGAAEYKERLGAQQIEIYSTAHGISVLGKMFCQTIRMIEHLKRRAKRHPNLIRVIHHGLTFVRRLERGGIGRQA